MKFTGLRINTRGSIVGVPIMLKITTCTLLAAFRVADDVCAAMTRQGIKPNFVSDSTLISACGMSGRLRAAVKVSDVMLRQGIKPNFISYSARISACENVEWPHVAVNVCEAMLRQGIRPNTVSYNALISAWERGGVASLIALFSACGKGHLQRHDQHL